MTSPDPTPIRSTRDVQPDEVRLSRVVQDYMRDVRLRCSQKTIEAYRNALDSFLGWVGDMPIRELRRPKILDYRQWLIGKQQVTKTTANNYVASVRRCLEFAVLYQILDFNPAQGITPLQVTKRDRAKQGKLRRALTMDEYTRLVSASWEMDAERVRLKRGEFPQTPLLLTLLNTGGRRGETMRLCWRHITFDFDLSAKGDRSLIGALIEFPLIANKTSERRESPVMPDVSNAIESLVAVHERMFGRTPRPSDRIFLTCKGNPWKPTNENYLLTILYSVLDRAGIERTVDGHDIDIHASRTFFNMQLHDAGAGLDDRADLIGHRNIRTTERHYTPRSIATKLRTLRQLVRYRAKLEGVELGDIDELIRAAIASGSGIPAATHDLEALAAEMGIEVNETGLRAEEETCQGELAMTTQTAEPNEAATGVDPRASRPDGSFAPAAELDRRSAASEQHVRSSQIVECDSVAPGAALWLGPEDAAALSDALSHLLRGCTVLLTGKRPGGAL